MEKMPFREAPQGKAANADRGSWRALPEWRSALPILTGRDLTLRELRLSDAPSLLAMITAEEVTRFISPPPESLEGFERFILWTQRQRSLGVSVCFGVVPGELEHAIGLFQVRQLEPGFGTAEWGFALGSQFWGRGIFVAAGSLVVDFVFDMLGTHRLEARAVVADGRGNAALKKIGAVQETVLRRSLYRHGGYLDQYLWAILDEEWREARRQPRALTVH